MINYSNRPELSDKELSEVVGGTGLGLGATAERIFGSVVGNATRNTEIPTGGPTGSSGPLNNAQEYGGNLPASASDGSSGGDDPNDSLDADGNYTPGWNASTD